MKALDELIKASYTKEDVEAIERFLEKETIEPLAALNYILGCDPITSEKGSPATKDWYDFTPKQIKLQDMFKTIEGFEDYTISTNGQIYSLKSDQFLNPTVTKKGLIVNLYKKGKPYPILIHTLVYRTFKGCIHKAKLTHKDGNVFNNELSNLEHRVSKKLKYQLKDSASYYYNKGYTITKIAERLGVGLGKVKELLK